ncbi:bifunctional 2-keto-4-hydroxyglutarate aldolase/2-keto-3-deoxy-6-phosphogluconate aldolase [Lederbergia citrea]|uniref:Bifunctional 2-keto-4-hydroxyglutarate aldolase/2-keto-3-deoxy-6-phosphogluconate aldolase n=1 Tax=Lederbergia citrea TaxID=2833581 RepID=A0A942Z1R1_9BACI|nr:bifunctional 2-keto-4-hydroxyglutarate aldolase/2-keto-3-deoxy-6-phosphogluconate aldolase [Lederbergia citrea]MBS4221743.1 bifunctional 2-keto-4-hydroxyglutarate aldolase/2-keto-3-deoxy-6-phosphogluconate aldolase [Lederbergia citrea]
MATKEAILKEITDKKAVAIIRAQTAEEAIEISEACIEGGVSIIEVTFTVPQATHVIQRLVDKYKENNVVIGAGSVLDPETARVAMLAGAEFIVSPYLNEDTAKISNRYRIPYMPGIMTIKESVNALELGVDILKLFPGDVYDLSIIKSIKGPLPQAQLMPTGGVTVDNVGQWLEAGACAVGLGSSLIKRSSKENYFEIVDRSRQLCAKIQEFKDKQ